MLIDWFTVIAQMINFLILVYLLKRFLYKPILNAVDAREKRIAGQLEAAAAQKSEAEEQHEKFQKLHDELNKNKADLIAGAKKEAEAEHQRLLEDARKEYDGLRVRLHESLQKEQTSLGQELKKRTQDQVFEIARRVLADLAGASLEAQIIHVFIQKLQALDKDEKVQLGSALQPSSGPLTIRSTFDLSPAQQTEIKKAVETLSGSKPKFQFNTSPDETGGIELSGNGFKIAWNIAEYLDSLEKQVAGLTDSMDGNQREPENIDHGN